MTSVRYISGRDAPSAPVAQWILSPTRMHPVEWGVHVGREWVRGHRGIVMEQMHLEDAHLPSRRLGGRSPWQNPSAVVGFTCWTFIKDVLGGLLSKCTYHSCHFGHW